VAPARVILVSDTHLSPHAQEAEANWDAVLRHITAGAPDWVIHLGDLSMDGAHDPGDLEYARRQLDRLPVPWHAVPGNHDIGDNPRVGAPEGWSVAADRLERWLDIVGPDHWSLSVNGWTLLGINAQLAESDLTAEAGQWAWLEQQLKEHSQPTAFITHKPFTATEAELAAAPSYRFLPPVAWQRIADLTRDNPPALVLSGHVHQHRELHFDGTDHLWVPTTWAVLPDQAQPVLGAKRCGIVSLTLDGSMPPQREFIEPVGIAQLTIRQDLPDPYSVQ
jgi:3',5'-cyclic AMP phosphodiesterase CpdA